MIEKVYSYCLIFLLSALAPACAQVKAPASRPAIANQAFDKRLQDLLNFSVPLIGVQELAEAPPKKYLLLDAREIEEYNISHIPGALFFGYKHPDWTQLDNISKDRPIVLYCSVGYRSEKIGEAFQERGFEQVYNLYGSIFNWANEGLPLENRSGAKTNQIHTYNKRWSQWVEEKDNLEKVW